MAYSDKVVDHFRNPRNVGSMDESGHDVGTGIVGAPECGDVMKLQIQIDKDDRVVDAKFKTFGCGSAIASSSLATEWIKERRSTRRSKSRTPTSSRNWRSHPSRSIAACWRRTPSAPPLRTYRRKKGEKTDDVSPESRVAS